MLATRPKTLPAAAAPVLVGTAIAFAEGGFRADAALAALVGALLIQIGSNLANDLYDFEKGTDDESRIGPLRVTQAGLLSPGEVRAGMVAAFGAATLVGIYLALVAGWPVVAIGVASIVAAIAYTGGPFPLGYNGLGDVFVMIFFGFVAVCGTAFVQTGRVPDAAWPASVAVGSLATAILVVNNVRDVETDRRAGKRTIPVIFGREVGVIEYGALCLLAFATPVSMVAGGLVPWPALACFLAAPRAVRLQLVIARTTSGPPLNRALGETAQLMLLHALLLSAGIFAGTVALR